MRMNPRAMIPDELLGAFQGSNVALLHRQTSKHHDVHVHRAGSFRVLGFGPLGCTRPQTVVRVDDPARPVLSSVVSLLAATAMHRQPARILCVGLGGGNLGMALLEAFPHALVDVVEIDDVVVSVASEWFGLAPSRRLRIHVDDGRRFIAKSMASGECWDVILQDCDDGARAPAHMKTREYMAQLRSLLGEDGLVACVSHTQGTFRDRELATSAQAFMGRLHMSSWQEAVDIGFATRFPPTIFGNLMSHSERLGRLGVDARLACHLVQAAPAAPRVAAAWTDGEVFDQAVEEVNL